ncbi:MAG: T9SS type A sorting domain-containing protein [Bacteroidales bacterium]
MKKIFILCFLSFMIITYGQSQNAPKTTVASVSACPNGSFNVSIITNSAVQIGALTLRLDFNPNLITYNSYSNVNSLLSGGITINSVLESTNVRYIKIFWLIPLSPNTVNLTAGKIVDLNFTLLSGSPTIQFNNTSNEGGDCEFANGFGVAYNDSLYVNSTITNLGAGTPGSISGSTNVCRGQNNVNYTLAVMPNATSYVWTLPTGASGTSSTNSINVNYGASAVSGNIIVKGINAACSNGTPSTLPITVSLIPVAAGTITGSATVCQGQNNVTYTVPSITNATSYVWTLPTGATGTSSTNSITVNYGSSAVSGNITVKGSSLCGDGSISSKSITVNPLPVAAGTITGSAIVCKGQNNVTYNVPTITNATSYVWTLPTGVTGTSSSNSITVNIGASAASGNITVKGNNSCGDGTFSSLSVTINSIPVAAGTITGSATVCQGQNNVSYTVPTITNATSYVWTLPTGATGTSSTNSISVNYGSSAVSGNITVKGTNLCGDGSISSKSITVNPLPLSAGTITGSVTVCQGQNNVTYNVPAITNATSYVWTLPTGATGTSSSNSISVNFGTSAVSGNITVKGNNSCGDGTASYLSITVNPLPVTAGVISGNTIVCQGETNVNYSVPPILNATSYLWILLSGTSGTSTSNSIITDFGTLAASGNIIVKGNNSCGNGISSSLSITVKPLPANAGILTGSATVMQGDSNLNYSVPIINNAISYNWTLPSGASIVSGMNTNSITVKFSPTALSGNITVCGNNDCGLGITSSLAITVNPPPCTQPTLQATLFTSSAIAYNSMTIGWARGNGDSVLVVSRIGSPVNADPESRTNYTANTFFGNGSSIGTGNFVVYKGIGTSVNLSGLTEGSTYYYAVYEYNSLNTCYKIPALTGFGLTIHNSTFTAAVSSNWETATNWSNGIPDSITNALIPANKLAIVNSINNKCHSLTIAPLGKLTINTGNDLTVRDSLILQSNVTGTASLIDNGTLYSSTYIAERYIPHTITDEFHMLSSPVATQAISPNFNESDGFFVWNEATGSWIEFADSFNFNTANGGTNFVPGKGYAIAYPNVVTKRFTGNLNTGTINIPLSYSTGLYSGWNFVANPYPSAINWNSSNGWSRAILENATVNEKAIWIWNPITANYGAYISNSPSDSGTNGVTNNIAISQGFWVKATTAGTLSMDNNVRQHASQAFLKTTPIANDMIHLKVTSSANTYSDELIINFGNETDQGGAEKMFSIEETAPSLYSTKLNKKWSIDNLTSITNNTIIPIGFKAGVDGNYNISSLDIQVFDNVVLEDIKTNIQHNFSNGNNYSFYALANDNPNRFLLHFNSSSILNETDNQIPKIYYTKHVINIFNPWSEKTTVFIYDINGKLLQANDAKQGNSALNFNSVNGVYIIKLQSDRNVFITKEIMY